MHNTCKKLTGQYNPSTPSLSSPGQEDWSLCTSFLYVSVSMVQYIAGKINF